MTSDAGTSPLARTVAGPEHRCGPPPRSTDRLGFLTAVLRRLPPSVRAILTRVLTREVLTFLAVGGTGYVVDVIAFNTLLTIPPTATLDPSVARTFAVVAAMCVTYAGNRWLTWREHTTTNSGREIMLFAVINVIGFGFSVGTLFVSHDLMHLTSRLADNVSANVVGLALGTLFRYLCYKHLVFGGRAPRHPALIGNRLTQSPPAAQPSTRRTPSGPGARRGRGPARRRRGRPRSRSRARR